MLKESIMQVKGNLTNSPKQKCLFLLFLLNSFPVDMVL